MPAHRDIPVETAVSLLRTQAELQRLGIPFELQVQKGSSLVVAARSKAAHMFLEGTCNRLFWVDSDMVWEPAAFVRLLALSTVKDVVCASYPSKCDPIRFMVSAQGIVEADEWGCLPLDGVGLGFTCVQRHVIEKLAERAPMLRFPDVDGLVPHIFRTDSDGDAFRGEDMAFFADVRALGFSVNVDPSITLGHHGQKTFTASLSDYLQEIEHGPSGQPPAQ